jgi:hypothetical protein
MVAQVYAGVEQTMNEQVSQAAISAMALKMYSQEELDRMSRQQLIAIYTLARANAKRQQSVTPGLLNRQREVLQRSLLHPALMK